MLSNAQYENFKKYGVLLVESFFSKNEATEMLQAAVEGENAVEEIGNVWKYYDMQKKVAVPTFFTRNVQRHDLRNQVIQKKPSYQAVFLYSCSHIGI